MKWQGWGFAGILWLSTMSVSWASPISAWIAQVSPAQISGVAAERTPQGPQVRIRTVGEGDVNVFTSGSGQVLVIDLVNAQLQRGSLRQVNPIPEIRSISVDRRTDSSVRVTILGNETFPTPDVRIEREAIVIGLGEGLTSSTTAQAVVEPTPTPVPIPSPAPTATPESALELEEILVTAQRDRYRAPAATTGTGTETPILDIPLSIQVIPEAVIEDQQALDLLDVLRNAPGIIPSDSPRDIFSGFTVRGFNTGNTFLRNGVRDNDAGRTGFDLGNVERIEVLRGPASALFGQLSPGGAINIITKKPVFAPLFDLELTYGSFNTYQAALDLSDLVGKDGNVSYRLNASLFGTDTFIDEIDIDRYLIAPVITWRINENTDFTFEAEYLNAQFPNERGLPLEGTIAFNPNGTLPISRYLGEPSFDRNDRFTLRLGYELEHRFNENWRLNNLFRFVWEEDVQDSVAPFGLDEDLRTQQRGAFVTGDAGYSFAQNNYEFSLSTVGTFTALGADHELVLGADFDHQFGISPTFLFREIGPIDIFNPEYNQPLGPIVESFDPSSSTATSAGIYLQDRMIFSDQLSLLVGGRFDYVNQASEDFLSGSGTSQSDTAFSPRVGLVYKPRETLSLYGSFSQSFEQVTGRSLDDEPFQPQEGTQYEFGLKADWLDQRLSTTLAYYDLTLENLLTTDLRDPSLNFSTQSGEQRSQGIEFNTVGEILPGWEIILGYAYTDARIEEDNDFPVGNRLINVPEHAANLWTTYTIPEGKLSGLGFGLGLFYVGERAGDLENSFTLPDYLRTDVAFYYSRDQLQAQLNIRNLFDTRYFEAAEGVNRIFPGAPLELLGTIRWEF